MDTEKEYLVSGPGSMQFEALQHLQLSLQSSQQLGGWVCFANKTT